MTRAMSLNALTPLVSSYTSKGTRAVVAMNVRYSAHRLLSHSPTISAASSAAKARSTSARIRRCAGEYLKARPR